MEKKHILVTLPVEERHKKMLEDAFPSGTFQYCPWPTKPDLRQAEIIIGNVPPALLAAAERLEWLQLGSSGADQFTQQGVLKEGVLLTSSTGAYGLGISEYLVSGTLLLLNRMNQYLVNQLGHRWHDEGDIRSIYGSRTLILGLGDIGTEYGKRMQALGSSVTGIRRHTGGKPEWLDALYTMDALDNELAKADIVAMALPNTPSTRQLMNFERLSLMKKNAILLNVGRGSAIVTGDLVRALNEGLIAGAYLDVTDPEPLPPDHPLWTAKNAVVTPHIAGNFHLQETFERGVRIACENLRLYGAGLPLKNTVDFETGYRKLEE
jgi:Phosphoglycerate dehydrogenase and related dehydrogenases